MRRAPAGACVDKPWRPWRRCALAWPRHPFGGKWRPRWRCAARLGGACVGRPWRPWRRCALAWPRRPFGASGAWGGVAPRAWAARVFVSRGPWRRVAPVAALRIGMAPTSVRWQVAPGVALRRAASSQGARFGFPLIDSSKLKPDRKAPMISEASDAQGGVAPCGPLTQAHGLVTTGRYRPQLGWERRRRPAPPGVRGVNGARKTTSPGRHSPWRRKVQPGGARGDSRRRGKGQR